uniref:Uncharacterized protein n=1 Tax=Moniliophthora roreri TaxID=221103 RepID=A0A0W0FBR1_MONRR
MPYCLLLSHTTTDHSLFHAQFGSDLLILGHLASFSINDSVSAD